jgi:hypothetical protein
MKTVLGVVRDVAEQLSLIVLDWHEIERPACTSDKRRRQQQLKDRHAPDDTIGSPLAWLWPFRRC